MARRTVRRAHGPGRWVIAATLAFSGAAHAQGVAPLGPAFVAAEGPPYARASEADVLRRDDGSFALAWSQSGEIASRLLDETGRPVGAQFQINTYTTSDQGSPALGLGEDGRVLVVWDSRGSTGSDASGTSIQMRWLAADGDPIGSEHQLNELIAGYQASPVVASDPGRQIVAVWLNEPVAPPDDSGTTLRGRRIAMDGTLLGAEFQVNQSTHMYHVGASIQMDPTGGFVVAWRRADLLEIQPESVRVRRFGAFAVPEDAERSVSTFANERVTAASVTALAEGYVTVWENRNASGDAGDGSSSSLRARVLDGNATPLGEELAINRYTTGRQGSPRVAADGDGGFLLSSISPGFASDPDDSLVLGQRFAADAAPAFAPFWLTGTLSFLDGAWIEIGPDRVAFALWVCEDRRSICGRRFALDDTRLFADGFDTGAPAFWSEREPDPTVRRPRRRQW